MITNENETFICILDKKNPMSDPKIDGNKNILKEEEFWEVIYSESNNKCIEILNHDDNFVIMQDYFV